MNSIFPEILREVVAALMLSSLYFEMSPKERLGLAKKLAVKYYAQRA